jgi:hypothetical protein
MISQKRYPRNSEATVDRSTFDSKTSVPEVLSQVAEMLDKCEGRNKITISYVYWTVHHLDS